MSKGVTLFRYPARLETLTLVLLKRGRMTVNYDMQRVEVSGPSVVGFRPGSIVNIEQVSEDFCCAILLLEQAVLDRTNVSIQKAMPYIEKLHRLHSVSVQPEKMEYGMSLLELMSTCIQTSPSEPYYHESVHSFLTSFVYYILNVTIQELATVIPEQQLPKSNEEEIFQRFMKELRLNFIRERKISFYAGKLNLSPKYFSSVVRRFSGRGPSDWIDECVIAEAKNLLRFSNKNIQEIAFELNFPTQSFFGRFFKRHTGYSPRAFKML